MASLFDEFARSFESQDEGQEASPDAAAQAVVNSLDDDIDEELSEAEKRLSKAAYYKAIVRGGVIEDDGTSQSAEVNAEAKIWARQMMAKLLGLYKPEAAVVESPFTTNEVTALKKLAGFALAKMGELPNDPVVKKIEAPQAPQVRRVQAQQKAPIPQPKNQPKPATKAPAAADKKKPIRVSKDAEGKPDYVNMPSQTVFKDVDGQLYKMVDNPNYDPDRKGSKPRTKLKVTNQVRGTGALPTPNKQQMEAISASQAMDTVNNGTSASATSPFGAAKDEDKTQGMFVAAAANALRNEN